MKRYLLLLPLLAFLQLGAQDFVILTVGASYANQVYYSFENDLESSVPNPSWDLAFTVYGDLDAGIHLNESVKLDFSSPPPGTELYLAPTSNFDDSIDPDDLESFLGNDEVSWEYGAVNSVRNANDPNDYGWGSLDPQTGVITGQEVFVLQLRNGVFLKFEVQSLEDRVYTLRYADLDGANEQTLIIDKRDFPDADLAFYSFQNKEFLTEIQDSWDLFFGRYLTLVPDGTGGGFALTVTGTLSGVGVQVAEADGVNPLEVEFEDYRDSLDSRMDIIGYDWKEFDNYSWAIDMDKVFFVKTKNDHLWKMQFFDFGGSSNGEVVFEKTDLGVFTNVLDPAAPVSHVSVFPNPGQGPVNIALSVDQQVELFISLIDTNGRTVWEGKKTLATGLQVIQPQLPELVPGIYQFIISDGTSQIAKKFVRH